ncbi:Serine protease AprX [Legionella massiliensis]|uniref:Serine protease AprX n=1 Tax=Legionella massiliensis TaxID=1034943 RepID=A0A078KT39_9GAMM|nr:S8 family serine peptidase [Legionella massiliensis]CDZ77620.1 Serine protease AprX [Legionella massiliensis]CEE13358.1 Serine protease AprX [Legionella massiliensis]
MLEFLFFPPTMKKLSLSILLIAFATVTFGKALVDGNVVNTIQQSKRMQKSLPLSLIVFLHSNSEKKGFLKDLDKIPDITFQEIGNMPAIAVVIAKDLSLLETLADHPAVAQITVNNAGTKELDITTQALKLTPSVFYPNVSNWWAQGYTGQKGVIGVIDDGIAAEHPNLTNKRIIIRKEDGSLYNRFLNGVRTAHGTGVACIYTSSDPFYKGIAYGATTIVSGLSGEETANVQDIMMTMATLDWMLTRAEVKPTIINYSIGNGSLACKNCPEWSGLAKVIDYIVNHDKILWVKSAGNNGYIEATQTAPFASTLTVPGDNYNALTIANMDTVNTENFINYKTANRDKHRIHATSSRGPTPYGRRKPDLSAPGYNTRTCAPDPQVYGFNYSTSMDYHEGFRLMGGTSSAAPHVGASALLIQDAGIKNPIAVKALLINSADAWTDNSETEAASQATSNHYQVMGSEWNRTYGWGYIDMQKAFEQRNDIIESTLTVAHPIQEYEAVLEVGDKVTVVHERRVGYFKDSSEWKLSHISLELIDYDSQKVIARDDSPIDTVHQVANCSRQPGERNCSSTTKTIHALVRVKLLSPNIDGSVQEPFALVLKQGKA